VPNQNGEKSQLEVNKKKGLGVKGWLSQAIKTCAQLAKKELKQVSAVEYFTVLKNLDKRLLM